MACSLRLLFYVLERMTPCSAFDEMIRLVNVNFDVLEEPSLVPSFATAARSADTGFPLPKENVFMLAFEQGDGGGLLLNHLRHVFTDDTVLVGLDIGRGKLCHVIWETVARWTNV